MPVSLRRKQGVEEQIGDVKHSVLTEAQFQELHGTTWVLMKGQSITGSDLAAVSGITTLPDARGVFIRGKNNGRADGNQDPDGERAVGNLQGQQFGSHSHGGAVGGVDRSLNHYHNSGVYYDSVGGGGVSFGQQQSDNPTPITTSYIAGTLSGSTNSDLQHAHSISAEGGNETRPRNIALNTFIKINR